MRIYLVHWQDEEIPALREPLENAGHEVSVLHTDGSGNWKELAANPPDAMLISMRRLPSHGRRVAFVRTQSKWMSVIPLAFFDASPEDEARNRLEFPDAAHLSWKQVPGWLATLPAALLVARPRKRRSPRAAAAPGGQAAKAGAATGRTRRPKH